MPPDPPSDFGGVNFDAELEDLGNAGLVVHNECLGSVIVVFNIRGSTTANEIY